MAERFGDSQDLLKYIQKYNDGIVDYWFITHPHSDHVGAMCNLLNSEDVNIMIKNVYFSFNELEWYEKYDKRGYEAEKLMYETLENPKIQNKISCTKNQIIQIDNIETEILRIANPEIINSDNGNDSSMCFKMTANDIDKGILFLGDAFLQASKELLESPEKLNSYSVQMSHHGQNGVTKEVYDAVKPKLCFFNAPEKLYNNDNGGGYNSGNWKSIIVREWVKEYGAESVVAYEGDKIIELTKEGHKILEEN